MGGFFFQAALFVRLFGGERKQMDRSAFRGVSSVSKSVRGWRAGGERSTAVGEVLLCTVADPMNTCMWTDAG